MRVDAGADAKTLGRLQPVCGAVALGAQGWLRSPRETAFALTNGAVGCRAVWI